MQLNTQVLDGRPAQNGVNRDVSAKGNTENSRVGSGVGIRQEVTDHGSEPSMCIFIVTGGILDSANELDGLKWVGVIKRLKQVDEVRVSGDYPLVEEQVA